MIENDLIKYMLCLFAQQPRRANALQYILIGKRTSSNLFAALRYHCLSLLQIDPNLNINYFKNSVDQLVDQHYLRITEKGYYQLTAEGQLYQEQINLPQPTHYDGRWMRQFNLMKNVVSLSIQVISQVKHQQHNYVPLINDLQTQWRVKHWFHQIKHFDNWQQLFVNELTLILSKLPAKYADLLANRFTGYQTVGLPLRQLTTFYHLSLPAMQVMVLDAWAAFWQIARQYQQQLPLLSLLLPPVQYLTDNVAQTVTQFRDNHLSIAQISNYRHLQPSTIREHLLEAAIITPFLLKDVHLGTAQQLQQLQEAWDNNQLCDYHPLLSSGLSFFQIRFFHIQRLTANDYNKTN